MNALIIVDVQNDFLPGGALPVRGGNIVIPRINAAQERFEIIVATQDWHPRNHCSFAVNHPGHSVGDEILIKGVEQRLWPVHCVQDTRGAEFATELDRNRWEQVFQKGTDPEIDSYSGFFDNGRRKSTGLGEYLRERGVSDVYIAGLATDYCVKYTALDALQLGFKTHLLVDACRGINQEPGDVDAAIQEVCRAGGQAQVSTSWDEQAGDFTEA